MPILAFFKSCQFWELLDSQAIHFWQLLGYASFVKFIFCGKPITSCQDAKNGIFGVTSLIHIWQLQAFANHGFIFTNYWKIYHQLPGCQKWHSKMTSLFQIWQLQVLVKCGKNHHQLPSAKDNQIWLNLLTVYILLHITFDCGF